MDGSLVGTVSRDKTTTSVDSNKKKEIVASFQTMNVHNRYAA